MDNIKVLIDRELERVRPSKRPAALIALRKEEYEWFSVHPNLERNPNCGDCVPVGDVCCQPTYCGLPVVKVNHLIEPVIIYTEAEVGVEDAEYLALD